MLKLFPTSFIIVITLILTASVGHSQQAVYDIDSRLENRKEMLKFVRYILAPLNAGYLNYLHKKFVIGELKENEVFDYHFSRFLAYYFYNDKNPLVFTFLKSDEFKVINVEADRIAFNDGKKIVWNEKRLQEIDSFSVFSAIQIMQHEYDHSISEFKLIDDNGIYTTYTTNLEIKDQYISNLLSYIKSKSKTVSINKKADLILLQLDAIDYEKRPDFIPTETPSTLYYKRKWILWYENKEKDFFSDRTFMLKPAWNLRDDANMALHQAIADENQKNEKDLIKFPLIDIDYLTSNPDGSISVFYKSRYLMFSKMEKKIIWSKKEVLTASFKILNIELSETGDALTQNYELGKSILQIENKRKYEVVSIDKVGNNHILKVTFPSATGTLDANTIVLTTLQIKTNTQLLFRPTRLETKGGKVLLEFNIPDSVSVFLDKINIGQFNLHTSVQNLDQFYTEETLNSSKIIKIESQNNVFYYNEIKDNRILALAVQNQTGTSDNLLLMFPKEIFKLENVKNMTLQMKANVTLVKGIYKWNETINYRITLLTEDLQKYTKTANQNQTIFSVEIPVDRLSKELQLLKISNDKDVTVEPITTLYYCESLLISDENIMSKVVPLQGYEKILTNSTIQSNQ